MKKAVIKSPKDRGLLLDGQFEDCIKFIEKELDMKRPDDVSYGTSRDSHGDYLGVCVDDPSCFIRKRFAEIRNRYMDSGYKTVKITGEGVCYVLDSGLEYSNFDDRKIPSTPNNTIFIKFYF